MKKNKSQIALPLGQPKKKTRSTKEAIDLLKAKQPNKVAIARKLAVEIAKEYGFVTSRMVRAELANRGLLKKGQNEFWLGPVFVNHPSLRNTGRTFSYSDNSRNIHQRTVTVWELAA